MQLARSGPDREHRRLVGVPRDAGRRLGLLYDLDVRMRAHELLALVAHPRPAWPGLAVGQREHHVAEQLGAGPQRLVGRLRRKAPDQQQLARHPAAHDMTSPVTSRATSAA